MNLAKLYFVTGKGGVGKTVTALAVARTLKKNTNKKILFNSFDSPLDIKTCQALGIEPLELSIESSATEYIGRKLKSLTIAKWVLKAPFFKALFNIVPTLGNMILLGNIIDILEKKENTIIVVDAPSSGHILTILESHLNFERIFKTGAIIKDITRMKNFIEDENAVNTFVISIPTELSVIEGFELKESLKKTGLKNIKQILNNIISKTLETIKEEDLPDFLINKKNTEQDILKMYENQYDLAIPMFLSSNNLEIIDKMSSAIEKVIIK